MEEGGKKMGIGKFKTAHTQEQVSMLVGHFHLVMYMTQELVLETLMPPDCEKVNLPTGHVMIVMGGKWPVYCQL